MATTPEFERFKQLFNDGHYDDALRALEELAARYPQSAALCWHRANCLEKLERFAEVPGQLARFLAAQPDYAPAVLKRVEYTGWELDSEAPWPDDDDGEPSAAAEAEQQRAQAVRAAAEDRLLARNEADLRRVLGREPDNAHACFLLANVLRSGDEPGPERSREADRLFERALELAPDNVDYLSARAEQARADAFVTVPPEGSENLDPGLVRTYSGICYRRERLESAVRDFERSLELSGDPRFALKLGSLLHDLGRYDEALARYDEALAAYPADDPRRATVLDMRARSENGGAGEREQLARLLTDSLATDGGKDRSAAEDMAAQALLGAAAAIRQGAPVGRAVEANVSDDPETMVAMNIARQILNVANEPPPGLVPVDAAAYPDYQRRHCDRAERDAAALGLHKIADAEALGMFAMLGQHVLLRVFRNDDGDIGMAAYAMKPKWPGVLAFLLLLLTGKWKTHTMNEFVTVFDDGASISTQPENISPFEYGGKIQVIKLPAKSDLRSLFERHRAAVAAYRAAQPQAAPMSVHDLAGVEARWVAGQQARAEYRRSIGYVTDGELKKLLGAHYERFAAKVRRQIQVMAPPQA